MWASTRGLANLVGRCLILRPAPGPSSERFGPLWPVMSSSVLSHMPVVAGPRNRAVTGLSLNNRKIRNGIAHAAVLAYMLESRRFSAILYPSVANS